MGVGEAEFSRQLYMNKSQLEFMIANGMHVGHHGFDHCWLNTLSEDAQRLEIQKGCDFLCEIGVDMSQWTMCYPYGGYDNSLIKILNEFGCRLALTTKVDVADIAIHSKFELPRLDTNDLPTDRNADAELTSLRLK